jgi:hypothetical protein
MYTSSRRSQRERRRLAAALCALFFFNGALLHVQYFNKAVPNAIRDSTIVTLWAKTKEKKKQNKMGIGE